MCLRATVLLALAGTSLLGGCATLLTPRTPPLTLRTTPDSVTVRHDGRVLGTAPVSDLRLRPASSFTLELSREGWRPARVPVRRTLRSSFGFNVIVPGVVAMVALKAGADPGDVVFLGLAAPAGALVDLFTGRAWEHQPRAVEIALLPSPGLPDLPADSARARVAATMLLERMAHAADSAGCDRVVSETWLDERDLVAGSGAVSRQDSALIERKVELQVDGVQSELRALCSRSNPLLDSLRDARESLAGPDAPSPADEAGEAGAMSLEALCAAGAFGHCITFESGKDRIDRQFGPALNDVAMQVRALRIPVRIIIQGTADLAGDSAASHRLGLRRAAAVRDALVDRGVPREWLQVESCGADPRCQLVPGASGRAPGARYNRRVAFYLRMEDQP